ncbi:type IV pilin N-terminal domain-containing protein [Methanoculleus sp.]|uniref:type IV pilin N-terminal domain-containing protein n=1 Tax=Methanoculleus sp. TaxID=90427 RepID=UPI002FCB4D5B
MANITDDRAVSEVVGIILLLSVTVLGVAIVAVTFFSQPAPSEIPHMSVVAGGNDTTFVLSHEGGDALTKGSYRIYVDTGSGLEDRTDEFVLTGDGIWSIGEKLTYKGTPERVVISVVDSGGAEMMIAEPAYVAGVVDASGYVDAGGSAIVPMVTVTPTPTLEEIIVSPDIMSDIDEKEYFDFAARIERDDIDRVDLAIYNYDTPPNPSDNKITNAHAYQMTKSAALDYYYNRTLHIVGSIGKEGERLSITVIAYNTTDIVASQSILATIHGKKEG